MDVEKRSKKGNSSNEGGSAGCCEVDTEHMFGLVGIVGTVLNLLVVVFIYLFTPD